MHSIKRTGVQICFVSFIVLFAINFAVAAEKIVWKGQSSWAAGTPVIQEAADYFAKRVGELSGGRLVIEMHAAGAIVPGYQVQESVHRNIIDVGCSWAGYGAGRFPAAQIFGSVEGGPQTMALLAWVLQGGGLELWQEMYDRGNYQVKVLPPYVVTSAESFAWANKPIRKLSDFKGLKFRTPAKFYGDILTQMGASVVNLPGGEVVPALQKGLIDAAEFSNPCVDIKYGLHEVGKYLIVPGVHQPGLLDEIVVSKAAWDKLPEDLKAIVWTVARDSSLYGLTRDMELNPAAVEVIKEKGVEIIHLSPEIQGEVRARAKELYDEAASKDAFFAKVLSSQRKFTEAWQAYAEDFNTFKYK